MERCNDLALSAQVRPLKHMLLGSGQRLDALKLLRDLRLRPALVGAELVLRTE